MNPADLTLGISPNLTTRPAPPQLTITPKNGRLPIPRVDLEPIYTQLKAALGEGWGDYKEAVANFVRGAWNQAELSWELQRLLTAQANVTNSVVVGVSPASTLVLHNTLLAAIYANTLRDPPPSEVAPWVVATDKPSATAKNAGASGANDKAEERLKKEVMAIHPRDRRRIKTLKEPGKSVSDGFAEMQNYRLELSVKPSEVQAGGGAGSVGRTNFDVSIRRRYDQKLAEENLEFPTNTDILNRIEPICYEEGLVGGVQQGTLQGLAEVMEQATEVFLKELVGSLFSHTRSNGEGCISTDRFKKQLRREEEDFDRGAVQRSAAGLLPAEMEAQADRQGLSMQDLDLALRLDDGFIRQDRFLGQKVATNRYADLDWKAKKKEKKMVNGVTNGVDPMAVDEQEWGWRGAGEKEEEDLMKVLEECLAVG